MYQGESQVEDIVKAAKVSVFFIDDRQTIRPDDEGTVSRIREVCAKYGSEVQMVELKAQFRCSGADGYLNWVDHTLQIADTGNYDGWDQGLEFDYVGVIIGNDMKFDPETMEIYADYDNYYDSSGKKGLKDQRSRLTTYVKNIYRVLLSRGMKGCYVYCVDKDLQNYMKQRAAG